MYKKVFICLLVSCATASSEHIFRKDYKYHEEVNGWVKLHNVPANWHDARLHCLAEGASLASPRDSSMKNIMASLMIEESGNFNVGIYSGIHSTFSNASYSTIEGVPISALPVSWATGQPDHVYTENCVVFHKKGTLENVQCADEFQYICYKKFEALTMNKCNTVDNGYKWDGRTGHCYKFHQFGESWSRAHMICTAEGGNLAVINSDAEANILKELYAKYPDNKIFAKFADVVTIGIREWPHERAWYTVHGQTLQKAGYAKWGNGEPNNNSVKDIQNCGAIFRNGLLDDVFCETQLAFICEIDPQASQ